MKVAMLTDNWGGWSEVVLMVGEARGCDPSRVLAFVDALTN